MNRSIATCALLATLSIPLTACEPPPPCIKYEKRPVADVSVVNGKVQVTGKIKKICVKRAEKK